MNRRMPKLWQQAVSAALAVLVVAALPLSTAFADSKPYFQTLNGGPFVGGAFRSGGSCSSNYQRPTFPTAISVSNIYNGAIMAWAGGNRDQSAGSGLDAFATGVIEGNGGSEYGFYTGLSGTSALSFANFESFGNLDNPPFWGGIFEGANLGDAHCIPDYFTAQQPKVTGSWSGSASDYSLTGVRSWSGGPTGGGAILAGNKLTVLVTGNVLINGNITYPSSININDVPKFRLIVRGNIFIDPNVNRLDGWYIAQPTSGTTGGEIWTCHNGSSAPTDQYIRLSCIDKPLTIYGSLTAKQVNLDRVTNGSGIPGSPAETVSFSPEMILGGSFDDSTAGGTTGTSGTIQSLISLPPVF